MAEMNRRKFVHQFCDGNECELTVAENGSAISARWSRRPSMSQPFLDEYIDWQKRIMGIVAKDTGGRIAQVIQLPEGKCLLISVRPGEEETEGAS